MSAILSSKSIFTTLLLCWLTSCLLTASHAFSAQADAVVARVNGVKITQDDVKKYCNFFSIDNPEPPVRQTIIETLIDQELLSKFLESKKVQPNQALLDQQLGAFVSIADHSGKTLDELLQKRGLTEAQLKTYLSIPLKWQAYAETNISPQDVKVYFEKHKNHFDGTRMTARQIFWKIPAEPSDEQLQELLKVAAEVRKKIEQKEMTFEDAVKEHSQSPSAQMKTGLIEDFGYYGQMPTSITQIAFGTKEGEMTQPFVTPFGVHLLKIEKVTPGQFSLDDAYENVFHKMSDNLKANTLLTLRREGKIERF